MNTTRRPPPRAYGQDGRLIFTRVVLPATFIARLRGLLGHREPRVHEAWWFSSCSAVHTFGMAFPIDVLHLARDGRILRICASVQPSRISACRASTQVVELRDGAAAQLGLHVGYRLEVQR